MYFAQLANPPRRLGFVSLQTGFIDGAENVVFGSPSLMFSVIAYGQQTRSPAGNRQAWSLLVQQRMATQRATPLGELLKMDSNKMLQPQYAEAWTLVGLLSKQPVKFGKLLQEMSGGAPSWRPSRRSTAGTRRSSPRSGTRTWRGTSKRGLRPFHIRRPGKTR